MKMWPDVEAEGLPCYQGKECILPVFQDKFMSDFCPLSQDFPQDYWQYFAFMY